MITKLLRANQTKNGKIKRRAGEDGVLQWRASYDSDKFYVAIQPYWAVTTNAIYIPTRMSGTRKLYM